MAKGFGPAKPKKGNKKRQKAYLNLIFDLLHCPSGREPKILMANQNLIDAGLVRIMGIVAMKLAQEGEHKAASFLINLANVLAEELGLSGEFTGRTVNQITNNNLDQDNEILDFLCQVLWKSGESAGDTTVVYPLLEANLDKLDAQFPHVFRRFGEYIQSQFEPEQFAQFFHRLKTTDSSEIPIAPSLTEPMMMAVGMLSFSSLMLEFAQGNRVNNIEIGIAGYEILAQIFTHEVCPQTWGEVQSHLGVAYRQRICGERKSNIERAIAYYQNALKVFTRETFPARWGDTQYNLAIAYSQRLEGNRAENLEKAIAYANEVLQVCTREALSEQWGDAQINLGSSYLIRVRGEKADNLEEAIHYYKAAEQVFNREAFSKNWARIQMGLGLCYFNRIKGESAENLEQAIRYFKAAMEVLTPKGDSVDWVKTQTHLGDTYWKRIQGRKAENLELAIDYYQAALQVATVETMPEQWAMVQSNLGAVYSDRPTGDRMSNLKASIRCKKAALQVYTRNAFPQEWATQQNNLGVTYHRIRQYAEAIECFQAALEVCTREAFPQDWAATQYNLGLSYRQLGLIEEALECFRLSLEIFKPTAFPLDCLVSGRKLGNTAFKVGRWKEAIEGYSLAIEAVETSRTWAPSESRRQQILAKAIDVYQNMVQACINAGQLEKALEYVERSRSKRLVDLMASNDLYQSGEIPPEVKDLLQQFDDLQQRIDQERSHNNSGNNRERMDVGANLVFAHPNTFAHHRDRASFQVYNDAIASLEAEKLQIWEQLRRLDPVLAGEIKVNAPNFAAMQQLIDQPTTAILSFYTTSNDTHIFILRKNQITLHTCSNQGIKTLQGWISQKWLQPYAASYNPDKPKSEREQHKAEWIRQISPFLTELAQRLQLTDLIAKHLDGIEELIIVPHLLLHQIPFAALPISSSPPYQGGAGGGEHLGDKFLIRYTPSCQVLAFCKERGELEGNPAYGTVEDAEDNLPCASFEGEQIAQIFNIPESNRLKGSTQATRNNYRQLAKQVQVLHSCHHAESCLDNPLNSQLKLGDGSITLGQLMTPGWRLPNLSDVFLSCCETGLGLPEITDDILTLSTGFLCAGARSVVSTLWSVDDLATALFSLFYYQHRQQGKNRPEALRQAQFNLRFLSGEELATQYKPELTVLLQKKLQQVEPQLKAAYTALKQLRKQPQPQLEGSLSECEQAYSQASKAQRKLKEAEARLESACTEQIPFSYPCYWAAFTCQGLR